MLNRRRVARLLDALILKPFHEIRHGFGAMLSFISTSETDSPRVPEFYVLDMSGVHDAAIIAGLGGCTTLGLIYSIAWGFHFPLERPERMLSVLSWSRARTMRVNAVECDVIYLQHACISTVTARDRPGGLGQAQYSTVSGGDMDMAYLGRMCSNYPRRPRRSVVIEETHGESVIFANGRN
jgi:hypothetical protein